MTRDRMCGRYPTAKGYDPYCPVCTRLGELAQEWDCTSDYADVEALREPILAQADRTTRIHRAYRRRQ
jgi:hypothetical protein